MFRSEPLWRPSWTTIDPLEYTAAKPARRYGPRPNGGLLARIAGHSLSFDPFGPPWPEELAAGLTTHGDAPRLNWDIQKHPKVPKPYLQYGLKPPEARIRFSRKLTSRKLTLERSNPVIYCEQEAVNLSAYDRAISGNQHVTFGPPARRPA